MNEVLIGEVLRPHGVGGTLKVYPLTADPERFSKLQEVILHKGEIDQRFKVISAARVQTDQVLLSLEGIESIELAEKFRGWEVRIDRSEVPPLEDGWYYFELEGMNVYEGEVCLGVLTEVLETGANDVYIVKGSKGEVCIPALKSVVKKVDVQAKRMDVILPPGLLED
ncbi:ribosome maturation factor RimM [Desulfosporosinus sp. PR]|uniref:ribosome maturation factor RimM n=1 Tax=Candidatus Desulfosporosinus nitrosoreducens TaxID=3401928 RepID=UPI0028000315|nr:ribosome maturation factor RimM [Desulfosporosinus sp. PR]MDQ7094707.1 ribosome maturation factor RimM [Desulfosporosinus sp. PR]